MLLRPQEKKVYKIVDSPEGVLDAIKDFEEELKRGEHEHGMPTGGGFNI